jgi:hypothetical protein
MLEQSATMAGMRANSGLAIFLAVFIASLPVLYVLSTGPAVWLLNRGVLTHESPIWFVYAPITAVVATWPRCEGALTWYLHFWDPVNY